MEYQPFYYRRGNNRLAFFIHGYMSSPDFFLPLSELLLREGYDCKGILLPGHGGSSHAFARVTAAEWKEHVQKQLAEVEGDYDKILFVGHSMGGTLGLLAASGYPKASGVFAMNPAVAMRFTPAALLKYIRLLLGRPEHDSERLSVLRSQISIPLRIRDVFCYIRPMKQLRDMMAELPGCTESISCPVFLLRSRKDETVSGRAIAKLASSLADSRLLTLPNSTHSYYPEPDKTELETALLRFSRLASN